MNNNTVPYFDNTDWAELKKQKTMLASLRKWCKELSEGRVSLMVLKSKLQELDLEETMGNIDGVLDYISATQDYATDVIGKDEMTVFQFDPEWEVVYSEDEDGVEKVIELRSNGPEWPYVFRYNEGLEIEVVKSIIYTSSFRKKLAEIEVYSVNLASDVIFVRYTTGAVSYMSLHDVMLEYARLTFID